MHYQQPSNQFHRPISGRLLAIFAIGLCLAIITGGVIFSPLHGTHAASAPTNWVQAGFNRERTSYNPFETTLSPSNVSGLTKAWTYYTGSGADDPIENNGILYFGDGYDTIYALNASTGIKIWSFTGRGGGSDGSLAVANGILYSASSVGTLYALNPTNGALFWFRTINSNFENSLLVANGMLYIGSLNHRFYALNATTGKTVWSFLTGGNFYYNAAIDGGVVYIDSAGLLYALNSKTGKALWHYAVQGSPVVANGLVYIGINNLITLNEKTGNLVWTYVEKNNSNISTVAVANGTVLFSDWYGVLYVLNAFNGQQIWFYDQTSLDEHVSGTPSIANGVVYAGAYEENNSPYRTFELAFDEQSGALLWQNSNIGCLSQSVDPIVVNGMMFFNNNDCNAMLGYRL